METVLLTTPWERSRGAMFHRSLDPDAVLLFLYPHPAPRLFHTFFCPPLRIIAVNDDGRRLSEQVVSPGEFVRLPPARIVVECSPALELNDDDLVALSLQAAAGDPFRHAGTWGEAVSIDRLIFALIADALADLRRVHEAHGRKGRVQAEVLQQRFDAWERGQMINSAGFLLDFVDSVDLPENAVRLSRQLLDLEQTGGHLAELTAASIAGMPWKNDLPRVCLRCGGACTWRPVLAPPDDLPSEMSWRCGRPENHVPLCNRCAYRIGWREADVRRILAVGLWGRRWDAFLRWYTAAADGSLPLDDWDREIDPLWPAPFGGDRWETGSGALGCADPRLPTGVERTREEQIALSQTLRRGSSRRWQVAPSPFLVAYEGLCSRLSAQEGAFA